jgi:hypothetical protein
MNYTTIILAALTAATAFGKTIPNNAEFHHRHLLGDHC